MRNLPVRYQVWALKIPSHRDETILFATAKYIEISPEQIESAKKLKMFYESGLSLLQGDFIMLSEGQFVQVS
jgi:hypothetical protein